VKRAPFASRHDRSREIGPAGTLSRVIAGTVAIMVPVALEGIGWWDVPALLAAPLIATAAASLISRSFRSADGDARTELGAICSPAGCVLLGVLVASAFALGEWTPAHGDVVLWGFLGASMLLAAVRGDGGCEVLAFPNAITGRRDRIGCLLFGPIDAAEARHRDVGYARARDARAVR
jgi:hypothetical protein